MARDGTSDTPRAHDATGAVGEQRSSGDERRQRARDEDRRQREARDARAEELRAAKARLEAEERALEAQRRSLGLEPSVALDGEAALDAPMPRPNETPHEIRGRYRDVLAEQEASLQALQAQVANGALEPAALGGAAYAGELGSRTYDASQLDAYKMGRTVAEDLVDELAGRLASTDAVAAADRSVARLEQDYAYWESAHQAMVEQGEASGPSVGSGGPFSALAAVDRLLTEVTAAQSAEVAAEIDRERDAARSMMRRVLLGAVTCAATGKTDAAVPKEATDALQDMQHLRQQMPEHLNQHHLHVITKWKGAPARKHTLNADGTISSDDDEPPTDTAAGGDEATAGATLALDTTPEQLPRGGVLRAAYIQKEQAFWRATVVQELFVENEEPGGECCALSCTRNGRLLAMGCRGGGVLVYYLGEGAADTPVPAATRRRKQSANKANPDLPPVVRRLSQLRSRGGTNAILDVRWSADGTELATVDLEGASRVWSIAGEAASTFGLSTERAATFWQQMETMDAKDRVGAGAGAGASDDAAAKAARAAAKEATKQTREEHAKSDAALAAALKETVWAKGVHGSGVGFGGKQMVPHLLTSVHHEQFYLKELVDDATQVAQQSLALASKTPSTSSGQLAQAGGRKESGKVQGTVRKSSIFGFRRKSSPVAPEAAADDEPAGEAAGPAVGGTRSRAARAGQEGSADGASASGSGAGGGAAAGDGGPAAPGGALPTQMWPEPEVATTTELPELLPLLCDFHPAFTLLGTQPSTVLSLRSGLVIKCNRPGAERVVNGARPLNPPKRLAAAEEVAAAIAERQASRGAAAPGDKKGKEKQPKESVDAAPLLPLDALDREYFAGHGAQLLCMGFVEHSSVMLTIDRTGLLLKWPYRREFYSELGWFRPSEQRWVDLKVKMTTLDKGTEQRHFPPDGLEVPPRDAEGNFPEAFLRSSRAYDASRVVPLHLPAIPWRTARLGDGSVCATYDAGSYRQRLQPNELGSGQELRQGAFVTVTRDAEGVLLKHETAHFRRKQLAGDLVAACLTPSANELVTLIYFSSAGEGPLLRLQLLDLRHESSQTWLPTTVTVPVTSRRRPRLAIGPLFEYTGTDYVYLLVDNLVRILSLGSGEEVLTLRPGGGKVELDSISISGNGHHLAVGASAVRGFWLYKVTAAEGEPRAALERVRSGSSRLSQVPVEQREGRQDWVIGTDATGFPKLGNEANVERVMQQLVKSIVDKAIGDETPPAAAPPAAAAAAAPPKAQGKASRGGKKGKAPAKAETADSAPKSFLSGGAAAAISSDTAPKTREQKARR